jgi:hypothetical protein
MKQNEQLKQPFFTKFLETQKREKESKETSQDNNSLTSPFFDLPVTNKWPSDGDEDF